MQTTNKDIQRFDRESSGYETWAYQSLIFDWVHRTAIAAVEAISPEINPDTILDIGCGTGRLLRELAERWPAAKLIGVDPAEGMIAEARRRMPSDGGSQGATFYVSMAERLPLPDAAVELAFSTISFHHWQEQAQGIREVARVLRPGGRFVLVDFSLPYILLKIFRHSQQLSPAAVRELFTQAGLVVQEQRRVMRRFMLITIGRKPDTVEK